MDPSLGSSLGLLECHPLQKAIYHQTLLQQFEVQRLTCPGSTEQRDDLRRVLVSLLN